MTSSYFDPNKVLVVEVKAAGPQGIGLPAGTADAGKYVRKLGTDPYAYELVTPDQINQSGEWSAETVSEAEARAGTATTRRAWTAQRVRQSIATALEAFRDSNRVYVSPNGNDLNNGTSLNEPLGTLGAAAAAAQPGDLVVVGPGVYTEPVLPVRFKRNVGLLGGGLRNTTIKPAAGQEMNGFFRVDSGFWCWGIEFAGHQANSATGDLAWAIRFDELADNRDIGAIGLGAFILKSPYIQNCSSITAEDDTGTAGSVSTGDTGGGILVDGSSCAANSPIRSMVVDSFTQVNLGGPGCLVINDGYAQLVSFFGTFCEYHVKAMTGGQVNLSGGGTSDFGVYGLVADGYSSKAVFSGASRTTNYGAPRIDRSATINDTTNTLTSVNHTLVANDQIVFEDSEAVLPSPLVINTIYYVRGTGLTSNTFTLSAAPDGAIIDITQATSEVYPFLRMGVTSIDVINFSANRLGRQIKYPTAGSLGAPGRPVTISVVSGYSFTVMLDPSTVRHEYVGGGFITVGATNYNVTAAVYNNATGETRITVTGYVPVNGASITLSGLSFICDSGSRPSAGQLMFPRLVFPRNSSTGVAQAKTFTYTKTGSKTFTYLEAASPNGPDHEYISGGTVFIGPTDYGIAAATYNKASGLVTITTISTLPGANGSTGSVTVNGLIYICPSSVYVVTSCSPIDASGNNVANDSANRAGYRVLFFSNTNGGLLNTVLPGQELEFRQRSQISAPGHTFEYVGAGTNYNALPFNGGVPIPANKIVEINNGRVYSSNTDELGNFAVGSQFAVDGTSGTVTITSDEFNLSGLNFIGPFSRNGGISTVGEQLREVSNNATLIASTGSTDGNTVPTQFAVRKYSDDKFLQAITATAGQPITVSDNSTVDVQGFATRSRNVTLSLNTANGLARLDSNALVPASILPNTNSISEGSTNLYYTNARARAAISVTGSLSYNATSGLITAPTLAAVATSGSATDLITGTLAATRLPSTTVAAGSYTYGSFTVDTYGRLTAASSGTAAVTSVNGTAPIVSSGGTTPSISIPAATATVDGYMSSADKAKLNSMTANASVSSVGLSLPNLFSVTGSPVTTSGTLTAALSTQTANVILAGPSTGSAAAPTFRALVATDLPNTSVTAGSYGTASAVPQFTVDVAGRLTAAAPVNIAIAAGAVSGLAAVATSGSATDLTAGTLPAARLPNTTVTPGSYAYSSFTVDSAGRLTSASNGTAAVTSVSGTAPIVSSGGTTPALSISAATTSAAGSMSSTDKTKLDGIATGATANATDAQLRDRATHTGNQTASTISDFNSAASAAAPVQSVAGKTGAVTLAKADVGLSNVDNTNDSAKPISTATQTALNLKANSSGTLAQFAATTSAQLLGVISDETGTGSLVFATSPTLVTPLLGTPTSGILTNCTGLPFAAGVSNKPTSLSGYGITDGVTTSDARLSDARTPTAHNQAWSTITGTPTTLSGYGITDTEATVRATPLTGYTSSPGTITATDSVLQAIQKLNGNIASNPGLPGGLNTYLQFNDNGSLGGDADLTYNKTTNLLTTKGDILLDDGGTFSTTLQMVTPTANRIISYPDATGTVALVGGSSGQITYNLNGANAGLSTLTADSSGNLTLSGRFINTFNSVAGVSAKLFSGTWFTGGTATTTKPQFLIEPAGTTSASWSTLGTGFGVNAASGFSGYLLDLQVNGARNLAIASGGTVMIGSLNIYPNGPGLYLNGSGVNYFAIGPSGQMTLRGDSGALAFTATSSALNAADTFFVRDASGILAQRNGTAAQASRIYNTYTDASNYERLALKWNSNVFQIEPEAAGTGTVRALQFPANGLESRPPVSLTGTWFTGGSGTTTKPQFLIEPAGTTSNNWSTVGTGFGVNAASGFAGNLLNLQVNGSSRITIDSVGSIVNPVGGIIGGFAFIDARGDGRLGLADRAHLYSLAVGFVDQLSGDGLYSSAKAYRVYGAYTNTSNYVRAALSSTSTAVTLAAETAGTGADDIPLNLTAAGTGTIKVNSVAEVVVSSTVAGLPAAPVVGMLTRVTNATAPVVGMTVAGGGAAAALVWYNGANWSVIGV